MTTNRSMPPGTIIPELAYEDVGNAAAWLCEAFGFKERLRISWFHLARKRIENGFPETGSCNSPKTPYNEDHKQYRFGRIS
jgi:hypothetical protein